MIYRKGFTLVELLVVIAIIAILASVVLVSLNTARSKGSDVKVISDIKQIKTQLENDYTSTNYPDLTDTGGLYGGFDPNAPGTTTITTLIQDIQAAGGSVNVVRTPSSGPVVGYALYGRLVSSSTAFFCLDSTGETNQQAGSNTGTTCPQ